MKRVKKGVYLIIFSLVLSACSQANITPPPAPEAIQGVLDLRDWDFEQDGPVALAGEWAFYWQELLPPDQTSTPNTAPYVSVPGIWSNYEVEGTALTPEGYATYTLTLYPPETQQTYGLFIEGEGSAYSLWADGRLIAQNGNVGTNLSEMTPNKIPTIAFFSPEGETVEFVIQISNFHHRKGGFRNELVLNLTQPTYQFQTQKMLVDAFSFGILFIMGLYHVFIYVFRTKNKAPLYFAMLCWLMVLRIGVTNQKILSFYFPDISWNLGFYIQYLTFFLGTPLFALLYRSLYPKDFSRWFTRVVIGIGIAFSVLLAFEDTLILSYIPAYYQIIILLEIIYTLFFLWRIVSKQREGAFYIGLASFVLFIGVVIEALYVRDILPIGQIASYSFLAFIFIQAVLLASRFSKSFRRVETLSVQLEDMNVDLQQSEIKYRTIFEDSKDIIFIAGLDSEIEDISPSCKFVLGYTKEELIQMTVQELMVDPAAIPGFANTIIAGGSFKNIEIEIWKKDGQKIDTLVSVTLRHNENGEVIGFQGSVRDITERKQAQTERMRALEFEQISITDPLTKIYNRRFFSEAADKELERAKRSGSPLAIIIFDIDHFKKVNDTYGHLVGDKVLINLADRCQNSIRSVDLFARFGGEEFVILMPDTDMKSAQETSERLREIIAENPQTTVEETDISITISIGIAHWGADNPQEINTLLNRADQALYQAKESGRNRVVVWHNNGVS